MRPPKLSAALTPDRGTAGATVSSVTAAEACRLLEAVFNTAVDDGLIRRNPCRIKDDRYLKREREPSGAILTNP